MRKVWFAIQSAFTMLFTGSTLEEWIGLGYQRGHREGFDDGVRFAVLYANRMSARGTDFNKTQLTVPELLDFAKTFDPGFKQFEVESLYEIRKNRSQVSR